MYQPPPSPHMWAVTTQEVSAERAEQIDAVAGDHGAAFVTGGEGRSWFQSWGPGRGAPFDVRMELAVEAALKEAGLWPVEP